MKVSSEKLENGQLELNIEADAAEVEESLEKAYLRLVKRFNVPGFRKGKAPRAILERYVGKEVLWEEAVEHLLPQLYDQVVEERGIDAIAQPQVEILQTDPLVFKATVPLRPKVKLGDYRQIRLSPMPVEVSQEEVDAFIERLRYQQAPWKPAERPVCSGDIVTIDIDTDAEPSLKLKDKVYLVVEGSTNPMPGFAEQLIGMETGQEKEFQLAYPADYEARELAGKEYSFKVRANEIKEKQLPELNDDFARGMDENIETLDALRERITANLIKVAEAEAAREFDLKVLAAVVDISEVEFPPVLVEEQIDRLLNDQAEAFGGGQRGKETYLQYINKTEEVVREEFRPVATQQVMNTLILDKVAEEEKIEISQAQIDAEVEELARDAGNRAEEIKKTLNSPSGHRSIEKVLLSRKAMQHLREMVTSVAEEAGEDSQRGGD